MLEYEIDSVCQNLATRFGNLVQDRNLRFAMPATAPTPRLQPNGPDP